VKQDTDEEQETSVEREIREAAQEEWRRERREAFIDKECDDADKKTAWYDRMAFIECSRDDKEVK